MVFAGLKACLQNEQDSERQYDLHRQQLVKYVHDRKDSLLNLKNKQFDALHHDSKAIRDMENLVLEANKIEKQLNRKQALIELDQNKSINNISRKNNALDQLVSNEHGDYLVSLSQILQQ